MRDELIERFTSYLDRALLGASCPDELLERLSAHLVDEPVAPIATGDFYAIWAELTAVTQEVKLQSRSFKQLEEAVQAMTLELRRLGEYSLRLGKEREVDIERRNRAESLDVILDVRDRLERGLLSAQPVSHQPQQLNWVERLMGKKNPRPSQAVQEGYQLGLDRLDEYLDKQQVRRLDCLGVRFDPQTMQAVVLETTDAAPEGTVLQVIQNGYEWRGEIHRYAKVKVAKPLLEKRSPA